ncbi:unnamed protein product [Urochloa decumbens]|uniref:DUF1618 domain-containing protein n=1 Tax=Urochloa decumbens TaxID=240449 RepID=A0ABC9DW93_9POAL
MDDDASRGRNNGSDDPTTMAAAAAATMVEEVLLDRYVVFEDELSMVIEERGGTPESLTVEFVQEEIFASGLRPDEMRAAVQIAMEQVMLRYRADIEAPADAILRQRKASRPSAVKKVPIIGGGAGHDAALYREALDGIEPHLRRVAEPPGISTLTLRVSWPGDSTWRNFPASACIAGADGDVLALYVGPYRPGLAATTPGFYLVYDAGANSVAVVPPLPPRAVTTFSHCCIGTGVAVLRLRGDDADGFALVELLPRQDTRGRISTAATVFTWRSSGPDAGRWVQTEAAALPLPVEQPDEDDDEEEEAGYSFVADTAFAIGGACLCWVDLLQGMLICDDVLADERPEFRFVPLPPGCSVDPDAEGRRGLPDQYRSMCCVERREVDDDDNREQRPQHTIKFVTMVGGDGRPINEVELVTWMLDEPRDPRSEWKRGAGSMTLGDIWADPTYKDELGLPPMPASHPVLSTVRDDVVYLELVDDDGGVIGGRCCMLTVDLARRRVLSGFKFPPGSTNFPLPDVFATRLHHACISSTRGRLSRSGRAGRKER